MRTAKNKLNRRYTKVLSPSCGAEIRILGPAENQGEPKEIIITCRMGDPCRNHLGNIFKNGRCFALCALFLGFHEEAQSITIRTPERTWRYPKEQVERLRKHSYRVRKCKTYLTAQLESCTSRICKSRDECLQQLWETSQKLFSVDPVLGFAYTPGFVFHDRLAIDNTIKADEKNARMQCNQCTSVIMKLKRELEKILFKKFRDRPESLKPKLDNRPSQWSQTDTLTAEYEIFAPPPIQLVDRELSGRLLDSYKILTHRVDIIDPIPLYGERFYCPNVTLNGFELDLAEEISRKLRSRVGQVRAQSFSELVEERFHNALYDLETHGLKVSEGEKARIALISTYHSLNMTKVLPYLLDDKVEEIFLDNPETELFIDHRKWGRCSTSTKLTACEVKTLKTRVRIESGLRLDLSNPSIKTDLITKDFRTRFSIDIAPLAAGGFSLDIRKLRKREFTLPELIKNRTLTPIAAAYLFFLLSRQRNITVIGEPGSGKTTLINALDLLTPKSWRKITIEDTIESVDQTKYGKHQTRFKVHPFESRTKYLRSKESEIIKLLHRAPDWIYLGEIQTSEHTKAMFHALSAGLRGLQTTHAASPKEAVHRWVSHHGIPLTCLNDLDTIVHIKKLNFGEEKSRRVVQICEIGANTMNHPRTTNHTFTLSDISICSIFAWNPEKQRLMLINDPWNSRTVGKIRDYEKIDKRSFEVELKLYKTIFEHLSERETFEIEKNVEIFHRVNILRERGELFRSQNEETLHNMIESLE